METLSTPAQCLAYAARFEDMLLGTLPEDHAWILVQDFPVAMTGKASAWRRFWREENSENPGVWSDGLLEAVASGQLDTQPLVLALCEDGGALACNTWDGNHRLAAAVMCGRKTMPVVVGIPNDLDPSLLPDFLRPPLLPQASRRPPRP